MERSVQVMFWVLFARDNVDKPQAEVHSAVAAAKIEETLNSTRAESVELSYCVVVLAEEAVVQPKM